MFERSRSGTVHSPIARRPEAATELLEELATSGTVLPSVEDLDHARVAVQGMIARGMSWTELRIDGVRIELAFAHAMHPERSVHFQLGPEEHDPAESWKGASEERQTYIPMGALREGGCDRVRFNFSDPDPARSWREGRTEWLDAAASFLTYQPEPVPVLVASDFPSYLDQVYVLTTLRLDPEAEDGMRNAHTRGIFRSLEEAHGDLMENRTDLYEAGYYPYAVLEVASVDAPSAVSRDRVWYRYDRALFGYRRCEEPESISGIRPIGVVPSGQPPLEIDALRELTDPVPELRSQADAHGVQAEEIVGVTLLTYSEDEKSELSERQTSVGLFSSIESAHAYLQRARPSPEGHDLALVEAITLDWIDSSGRSRTWYRFDPAAGCYRPTEGPKQARYILSIGGFG